MAAYIDRGPTAYIDRGPTPFSLPSPRGAAASSPRTRSTRTQSSLAIGTEEVQESGRGARFTSGANARSPPRIASVVAGGVPYAGYDPAAPTRPRSFFEGLCLSPRKLSPRARLPKLQVAPSVSAGHSSAARDTLTLATDFGVAAEAGRSVTCSLDASPGSKAKVSDQGQLPKDRTSLTSYLAPPKAAEALALPPELRAGTKEVELLDDMRWILFPATQVEKSTEVPLSAAQRERGTPEHGALLRSLRALSVLRGLSDDELGSLVCACRLRSYPRYAAILRGGAPGPSCCLLLSGVAASFPTAKAGSSSGSAPLQPTVVTEGAVFDEGALVTKVRRATSLSAVTDCLLLFLSHAALSAACASSQPQLRDALHASAEWAQVQREVVQHLLQRRCFFQDLSKKDLVSLSSIMEVRHLEAGAVVFKEGQRGDSFYVLVDGEVVITKSTGKAGEEQAPGQGRILRTYTEWSERPWFGELSLWLAKPRFASAIVRDHARLLVLEAAHFDTFLSIVPEFRTFLNRRGLYREDWKGKRISCIQSEAVNARGTAAVLRLASSGKLGGSVNFGMANARANLADRAITAGRWEKLVYNLLKTVARDNTTSLVSYVSFRVDDYSACGPVRTHSSLQAALEE